MTNDLGLCDYVIFKFKLVLYFSIFKIIFLIYKFIYYFILVFNPIIIKLYILII